jgi:hypothetical protein
LNSDRVSARWRIAPVSQHPDLRPEEVYAALTYFYDHYEHLVQRLKTSAEAAELNRPPQAVSREELLRRMATRAVPSC